MSATIWGCSGCRFRCRQSTAGGCAQKYSSSGIPGGHRAPLLGRILCVFQCHTTSFKSLRMTDIKQKRRQSVSFQLPTWKIPLSTNDENKSLHHCDRLHRRNDHHASILWLEGDVPYTWARWSCLRNAWIAASCTFSVPQSVRTMSGQPPYFCIVSLK